MKLWLVRHAEVAAPTGLCYGRSDLPAEPAATARAAARLAAELPKGLAVRASPLQRCELLAQSLCRLRPDLTLQIDTRLREMDFGAWEGRSWADIARADFDAWLADFADARPAGNGECVRELMARVAAAWDGWRASGHDAVWITHAGVVRAALLLARGLRQPPSAADWPAEAVPHGLSVCIDQGTLQHRGIW